MRDERNAEVQGILDVAAIDRKPEPLPPHKRHNGDSRGRKSGDGDATDASLPGKTGNDDQKQ
jgi:hypothetical protein